MFGTQISIGISIATAAPLDDPNALTLQGDTLTLGGETLTLSDP